MSWRNAGVFIRVSVSIESIDESKESLLYDLLASSCVSRNPDVLSIGFSGFLSAINEELHVLTSHWPFLQLQRTIGSNAMSISIQSQNKSTWIPCKLVYSSQLPCSCEKQLDKYPDKWGLAVLEIIDEKDRIKLQAQAFQLTSKVICFEPLIASSLLIVGNPFGFLNASTLAGSVMSGIVSQILAHEPTCSNEPKSAALLLSDAVVFLGTQGGPVFDALTKRFIGIVVPSIESLPSTTHRPVLTPIIPVQSILQMIHHLPMKCPKSFLTLDQHHHHAHKAVHKAIKSVVLLRTNARSWATGVLLNDAGLLLTAGHVLLNETIQVEALVVVVPGCSSHLRSQWRSTNVLYVASNRTIDIALLQIEFNKSENRLCPQYHVPYTWKSRPPTVGTRIFSIGFPTMDPFSSSFSSTYTTGNPLVTSGIVSKLVSLPEDPSFLVMIRTSARIMNGHSGGMLVDATDGSFLGLIVSNLEWQTTNDHSRRMIIEQINASLPMCSILSGCQVLCRNEFTVSTTSTSGSTIMQEVMEVMEHPWKNQEKAIGRLWAGSEEKSSTRLHNTLQSSSTTKKIITSASSLLSSL